MMSEQNPYMPVMATVQRVAVETPTIRTITVQPETTIPFLAGQFMQLTVPGIGEAPFTPSSSPHKPEALDFTILKMGTVTERLHEVEVGDMLGVRGPFGKGYPIDRAYGGDVLVVGGGCGLAPLRSLIFTVFGEVDKFRRVRIKYGAKTPQDLVYRDTYAEWGAIPGVVFDSTCDVGGPGWSGNVGMVTTLLDNLDIDIPTTYAFVCGPEIMLKFVTYKLLDLGFDPKRIYLSMNRRMSCGTGKCGRCNVGPYYLCKDGPDMCWDTIKDYPNVFGM